MALAPQDLARLLEGAQNGPHYSIRAALSLADGQPPPRIAGLVAGLTGSKRALWARIAQVTGMAAPPDDAGLTRLSEWEVQAVRALKPEHLAMRVQGRVVEELLLEHVREVLWTAGQIAAYANRVRFA
ncbi:metal binding protein family Yfit/DinB [Deinococcus aerius]|uniref:Metal binding protein family Yfit/DinB n=1 Tax=Deinococcus aerius TaxID=200253 RepID=A0A2I9CTU8_9DEIO|nr:metal binding protein family Yfit/DinB [Deinococcus aerius]